jgi:hypothetical protein
MSKGKWNDRITWRGKTFTRRAVQSLRWAEDKAGVTINPSQGSFNGGGVAASGGTHDGEAIDIRVGGLSRADIDRLVHWLRRAGWAAWYRPAGPSWGAHIHAVPTTGILSAQAASQVRAFDAGRDGLRGNRIDPTWRPKVKRRWSYKLGKPVPRV